LVTTTSFYILTHYLELIVLFIKKNEIGGSCGMYVYRVLVGRPEGKRPLGRPRCRYVDNIKINLQEGGWGGMNWIDMAKDRDRWCALVNAVMNLWVP